MVALTPSNAEARVSSAPRMAVAKAVASDVERHLMANEAAWSATADSSIMRPSSSRSAMNLLIVVSGRCCSVWVAVICWVYAGIPSVSTVCMSSSLCFAGGLSNVCKVMSYSPEYVSKHVFFYKTYIRQTVLSSPFQ